MIEGIRSRLAAGFCRVLVLVCLAWIGLSGAAPGKPNVLFIAVDDLRVELGCYGQEHVLSPHIDRLAAEGMLFERAYCQQTVCNPSRASVLTGLRPDTLRVWDLVTHFRENRPDTVTLPQLFRRNGYHARCIGKIFHNWRQDDWKGDPQSWSVPSVLHYNSHANDKAQVEGELPPNLASGKGGAECRDVPDEAYFDGRVAKTAVEALRALEERGENFFLAVGFWKPHTPFNAPKKYWDLYDPGSIPLPKNLDLPAGVPEIALTGDRYTDGPDAPVLREMHHGHLAAISYLDAQVGKVLDELDALGLRDDTIVVFWSDHGLHLGEHGLRRKTTVFELDGRVPLIVDAPGLDDGDRSDAIVELLDLYPTLADLCGLDSTGELEGDSLVPLLEGGEGKGGDVALTQTPRPNYPRGEAPEIMGYSLRSDRHRYTEWRDFSSGAVRARELYDHSSDPLETENIVENPDRAPVVKKLATELDRLVGASAGALPDEAPDPVDNPLSPRMLSGDWVPDDPGAIDFSRLTRIPGDHAILSDVRDAAGTRVHQHAYLARFGGRFFAMWSDGPGAPREGVPPERHRNVVPGHDLAGNRVSFATSPDGLTWSEPRDLAGDPRREGFGWISRGMWVRDGELLALASHFRAPGYPGRGLSLEAFRWNEEAGNWEAHGTVLDDTLNNFPPKKLPTGEWMMTRRDHRRQVSVMIGGTRSFDDWEVRPLASYTGEDRPEEPCWYRLPDGKNLVGLVRDTGRSGRILRTFSTDSGRSWTSMVKTDFPDATSKFFVHRTSRGPYVLVSNSDPKRRDPLTLAVSEDGLVFDRLFYLVGGRHVDYPHIIEHDGHLFVAFSGAKQTMEVVRVALDDLLALGMPASVVGDSPQEP